MKLHRRLTACILIVCMILPMLGFTSNTGNSTVTGNPASGFTILGDDGTTQEVDQSWVEKYPYGIFALGNSELVVTEGGEQQVLSVYRLGGTANKASAIIYYQPAVVKNADGSYSYSTAISADDITIKVQDPLPITAYQPWGMEPDPEETSVKVRSSDGVDGQGKACTILSLDATDELESYQWYTLQGGDWVKVISADGAELPVGEGELDTYDFRCVFAIGGTRYCTASYKGVSYEKPEAEELPEAPADIELNPAPTYTELELSGGNSKYDGWYFEVCFADGEYKKDILISAQDDSVAELDKYAAVTITDCIGGDVLTSLNTLMLRLADNDDSSEPSQVGFEVKNVSFDKSESKAVLTVRRTGNITKAISVDWALEDGEAKAGVDYVSNSGTLYFYGDQTEQTIEIELVNDKTENPKEKEFTVRLSNLLGDDNSSITSGICTVGLYNTNTAMNLNLASSLYDTEAVDVSSAVEESSGASVSSGTITGSQITSSGRLDALSDESGTCTVDWGSGSGGELDPLLFSYGKISFSGGGWSSTTALEMSLSSSGGGSTTKDIPNMGQLYKDLYAPVYGGAKFASGWDRFWYGDEEYAYTYFRRRSGGSTLGNWDCSPKFSGGWKINLSYYDPFYVSDSWGYTDTSDNLLLGVAKKDSCNSDGNISAKASVRLTRRTFSNDFYLNLYTANDSDIANVAKYTSSNYSGIIQSIVITEGGTLYGKLYEGSTVAITLGNTHLAPYSAYIVNASGSTVATGTISGNKATFNNLILPPDGTYTFRLVLDRKQNVKIDVTTSSEVDASGNPAGGTSKAYTAAYNLLKSKNTKNGMITVGYTPKSGSVFSTNAISTTNISISGFSSTTGVATTDLVSNIQYINFNLSDKDIILLNGKAYAGNETIWLETKHLTPKDLTFYFYEEEFLTAERPMKATIDSTAVYYDGDGDGRIDGYFDEAAGVFVTEGSDTFVAYLDDGDYEETKFQPVVDDDGTIHQYFMRPYYTANPVCLVIPQGHSDTERMQVMPNLITDITDSTVYESLTTEQKQYRTIISGESKILREGSTQAEETGHTADNHYKYTSAASVYSYVDVPLGGDTRPAKAVTSSALGTSQKNGEYTKDGVKYMLKDGLAYYYSSTAPSNLGNAVYSWTPNYKGNLLYKFDRPQAIYIANSLAGSRIPITSDLATWYLKADETWTKTAPTDATKGDYETSGVGSYTTETRAGTAGSDALNNYLGAFGSNDTFALVINEQLKTTGGILDGLGTLDDTTSTTETITHGTVGSFPDSSYLQQSGASGSESSADSGGEGSYNEFSADVDSELFSFNSEMLSMLSVEIDGYEITFSVGIPVYGKDNGGATGSASNTFDDAKETISKLKEFKNAVKDPNATKKDALKKLVGEDFDSDKLKSKSIEFTVNVSLAITLKYNPLDNKYKFSEAALAATVGIEVRLQYRFTPAPIFYVYAQFGAEGSISTGLGQNRTPIIGDVILQNKEVKLYETPSSSQSRQYFFTSTQKAFNITFSGKLYMECYEFTDSNSNGKYDAGETLGSTLSGFSAGYISSDGKGETEIVLKGQDQFTLAKPVVVVLTVMDDGKTGSNAQATITYIALMKGVDQELYWSGFHFEIEGTIELGIGIGIEIAKVEIYAKASLGIAFTLGAHNGGGSYSAASFDEFSLAAGLGFRIVFLFFNYEMDLIEYHLNYDGEDDKWTHGWSALGGMFGGDSDLGTQDYDSSGKINVYITPPSKMLARVYGNNVTYQDGDVDDLAYDSNTDAFQVSGYGSSVNAFKLLDNVVTGYDYRIVTVGHENYVVYTGTRGGDGVAAIDNTRLMLSRLKETDDAYGLVNPISGKSTALEKAISVDDDDAGDLDFYTWAEGDNIHVIWVSYKNKMAAPVKPDGSVYTSGEAEMTKDNYLTISKPDGGIYLATAGTFTANGTMLVINGQTMTASNYGSITIADVSVPGSEPIETNYYTTTFAYGWSSELDGDTTYYFPSIYADLAAAKQAYETAQAKYDAYQAYLEAMGSYNEWVLYYKWYNYFASGDVQNQVVLASRNTVVRHAVFDTDDAAATGFSTPEAVSATGPDTYYFVPQAADAAAVYAQSVLYSESDLETQLQVYGAYLDKVLTADGTDGTSMSQSYIAATKTYRMAYQQSLLSVYGGNSRLTVTAPDGTAYANGVMYVSKHQEDGNGDALEQTNEILTNLQITKISGKYYLAYITQQDRFEKTGDDYTDMSSISRLYLRSFAIEANDDLAPGAPAEKIVWGDPYLLRTVVNYEQDGAKDGVYDSTLSKTKSYIDPYMSNLSFLSGALGDKLTGTSEDFEPFGSAPTETFLLFEMNGNTYVIDQDSLLSITDPARKTGIIYPFFTYEKFYGDALEEGSAENLSSGKSEVVIGVDGDDNIAAVYTGSVPNSVNNAIYIAYWDPENGTWSDGVMLAMNYMDVYEHSVAEAWDAKTTEGAYFNETLGGGMTQFTFSNLQIALGRSEGGKAEAGDLSTLGDDGTATVTTDSAASAYADVVSALGLPTGSGSLESLAEGYSKAELYALEEQAELLGADTGSGSADSSELLILTQGLQQRLAEYESSLDASKTVIAPQRSANGTVVPGNLGIYAISYGKGNQQVGSSSIRFSYHEFTDNSRLHAIVSFKNVGDAAIRGSQSNPTKVQLRLYDADGVHDAVMAEWTVSQNIGAGQTVSLSTTDSPCKPLASSLGTGDYFYITLSEDSSYVSGAYSYDSSSDSNIRYTFNIDDKPEMGIEQFKSSISDVEDDGDAKVSLSFDATNRGSKKAEEVFVQLSYASSYDGDGNAVYSPLDLTDSEIYVSQQKLITDSLDTLGTNDLSRGIIYLGTDPPFYTDDYYITAAKYNAILGKYYSTTEVSGWEKGTYNNVTYWYNKLYHISAYAAYTAGQEAVKGWSYDSASQYYYNSSYASYSAAKAAADTARMAEYIITKSAYNTLSASQQTKWVVCSDNSSYYTLAAYQTYAAAHAAYQIALADNTQDIISNYCRSIKGTVNVSPNCFKGNVTGSLDIRVKVFSSTSGANYDASTGLYSSDHSDEYYSSNNEVTGQIEQATFVSASPKITLALGSTHRLPASIRTTTGKAPEISVVEVEDGNDELSTLYYLADADSDNVASTATGAIVIVGNTLGTGVIHVIDSVTNTTYPITYRVAEASDGTNIYNDDAQFTFYNNNGTAYNENQTGQSWKFQELSSWTDQLAVPYLGNVAIGETGAYLTFETKASTISFNMIGSATVTSNKFPGTFTVSNSGATAPPTTTVIDFGNDTSVSHIVTVKVTGTSAYFDTLKLGYSPDYTPPSDDLQAPGIHWTRSFPTQASVESGEKLTFTVYAIDESGLQSLSFNGSKLPDASIAKHSQGMWSYTFEVTDNSSFSVSATDTNGNTTSRPVTVDWFTASAPQAPEYGQKPSLSATAVKTFNDGSAPKDLFAGGETIVMTPEDKTTGNKIMLSATTDTGAVLSYQSYDRNSASFDAMESAEVTENGYYMVKSDSNDSYGTWSAAIFYIECFEDMPEINVTEKKLTAPNGYDLEWTASKSEESTAKLSSITINGISLSTQMGSQASTYSGKNTVCYGGEYTFRVTDTKGIYNIKTVNLKVPVDIETGGAIAYSNPWSQPQSGISTYGAIIVDFSKISGGHYTDSSKQSAVSLGDYRGEYEAIVMSESQYSGKALPGDSSLTDGSDSWLTDAGLVWESFSHSASHTWSNLSVPENGNGKYVVIIRDARNPKSYSTMAYQEITLSDNSIDNVSLSSRLASSASASDGEVYVSADKGDTETYEFAVLPLEVDTANSTTTNTVYKARTAEDFKANGIKWQLADWDSETFSDAALSGLASGWYQVAIRTFSAGGSDEKVLMAELNTLGATENDALKALRQVQSDLKIAANALEETIATASSAWRDASESTASLKTAYDDLSARLAKGDASVTPEQVDQAYSAWQSALAAEDAARTAWRDAITGASEEQKAQLADLRTAWLTAADDDAKSAARAAYETAVYDYCLSYQSAQFAHQLSQASVTLEAAEKAYDDKAKALLARSADEYTKDHSLWDSMLTGDALRIYVGLGISTSLKAVPRDTSQSANDGRIIVTAAGGSAYDGGETVHYQFAILPIKSKEMAVDYAGSMADIASLDLEWQFADDLADAHQVSSFNSLGSGWYQVFVRAVYDPDLRDGYDVNTNLYDPSGGITDLDTLRKAYDDAVTAAAEEAVAAQANAAHALYLTYQTSQKAEDYQAYLAAINSDTSVTAALDVWLSATDKEAKKTAYEAYTSALKAHFSAIAQAALYDAASAYNMKLSTLADQVEKVYSTHPDSYDAVSYTTTYVSMESGASQGAIIKNGIIYEDGKVTYKIRIGSTLLPSERQQILSANKTLETHLIIGDRHVVIPAGTLKDNHEVSSIISSFTAGEGNVVTYTDSEGNTGVVPASVVENGKIAYVYMGAGGYRVARSSVSFGDTANHWAEENILFAASHELFNGVSDDQFAPDGTMTRAMLVTVLYRMMGQPDASGDLPFDDVSDGAWYMDAVKWAYENGIVNGVSQNRFSPDGAVSRSEMVSMLYRALNASGFSASETARLDDYADVDDVPSYAATAFEWATASEIITGTSEGKLFPNKKATRAEVATVFVRIIRRLLK